MGPTCKRRITRSSGGIRKSTTRSSSIQKKRAAQKPSKMVAEPLTPTAAIATPTKGYDKSSLTVEDDYDFIHQQMETSDYCSPCTTPRSEKFRIPEIQTCPPAPKKRRIINYSTLARRPIAFFAPPDVELFFFVALRDIPAA